MLQENFSVLRTFKANIDGFERKVEQLLNGNGDRQEIKYRVYVEGLDTKVRPMLLSHEIYWAFNPVEVKG